jgi:hypothetical protein
MSNQYWTIQRNWQHWLHEDKKTQRNHSKICVGYHHTQGEDKHNTIFVFLRIFIDDVIA